MRIATLTLMVALASPAVALAQDAAHSKDAPIETKTQTANTGKQTVYETERSKQHEQNEHWSDAMNTTHSKDPRKKDEYGTPVPTTPKGQGTNSSTDAQRAADAKH